MQRERVVPQAEAYGGFGLGQGAARSVREGRGPKFTGLAGQPRRRADRPRQEAVRLKRERRLHVPMRPPRCSAAVRAEGALDHTSARRDPWILALHKAPLAGSRCTASWAAGVANIRTRSHDERAPNTQTVYLPIPPRCVSV